MILKKIYDEKTRTQKVWYDSSMIYYSKMVESETENVGDLFITFKNGSCYKYSGVKLEDYVLFVGGGTDASQGKTLNKIIKGKYEYERMADSDMEVLKEELEKEEETDADRGITYFISGHGDISEEEFEANYEQSISMVLQINQDAKFVVGDFKGVDIMAQNYLINIGVDPSNITVYHLFDAPRNLNPAITNLKGGFQTDEERDAAMTDASVNDIAFVRDINKMSGTAKNILRRYMLKTF